MTEKKPVGAPRKTPEGGQRVTFYLPKEVAHWIREQTYKAMEKKENEETENK